jgi:tellurite resistance protein TehA-like permease
MVQLVDVPAPGQGAAVGAQHLPFGLLKELDRPGHVFRDLGPNWYASIMGTGIVAIAGASLPLAVPGLHVFSTAVWALAAAGLIALTAAWAVHWVRYPDRARGHAAHPVMAHRWP